MKNLLFTIPLKPGTLQAYKAFTAENTGPRKREYTDLLHRYGLRNAKVWHQKLAGQEYIMVFHAAEDDAVERLKTFPSSKHPFDLWFKEQLEKYNDAPEQAHLLFTFDAI